MYVQMLSPNPTKRIVSRPSLYNLLYASSTRFSQIALCTPPRTSQIRHRFVLLP